MISLQNRVRELLTGVCTDLYYFYPASWTRLPCVSWRESGNRVVAWTDGAERLCEVTYTVDIWGDTPAGNAELAGSVDARLSAARFRRVYSEDIFEQSSRLHHRVLRYRAVADAAGNIYQ